MPAAASPALSPAVLQQAYSAPELLVCDAVMLVIIRLWQQCYPRAVPAWLACTHRCCSQHVKSTAA
jgi:hypothetical protein